jgi:DNA-binding CsgD family transcriptional regulator
MLFSTQSYELETSIPIHAASGSLATDASDGQPPSEDLDLADLWTGIVEGTHFLLEGYYSADRSFLTVQLRAKPRPRRRPLRMNLLERILLGESYKSVAIEQGLAVSTIALTCGDCLRAIGNLHLPTRLPAVLLMAVHASRGAKVEPARMYRFQSDGKEHWVVTAVRPDRVLPDELTPAEADVIHLLVEGNTHEQMAVLRSGSRRTVANQLAAAFRKLGVTGRAALLSKLIRKATGDTRKEATLSVTPTTLDPRAPDSVSARAVSGRLSLPKVTRGPTLST